MRVLFHYGLAIRLGLHFFATYSLMHIIAIVRANAAFLRLVVETRVFFILYLFPQQLLMRVILLNKIYCMAR